MYEKFTNQYKLSKTLRFGLIPQGRTLSYIEERGILEEDECRDQEKKKVQKLADNAHKQFIESTLSKLELGPELEEYADAYLNPGNYENALDVRNAAEDALIKQIAGALTADKSAYKGLFSAALFEKTLPKMYANDSEALEALAFFKGFTTYFAGYHKNRELLYDSTGKHGSVAARIIVDNLPLFLDNCRRLEKIGHVLSENAGTISSDFAALLDGRTLDEVFSLEGFAAAMTQKGIDTYNQLIGGYSKEDGAKIKGLNEYINRANQAAPDKTQKLPKLVKLQKQMLSEQSTLSFIPEAFTEDEEVVESLLAFDDLFMPAANGAAEMLEAVDDYDIDGIYIKADSLREVSNKLFDSWHYIEDILSSKYDADSGLPEKKRNSKKYQKKKKVDLKKISAYSIGELDRIPGIDGKLSGYVSGGAGFKKEALGFERRNLLDVLNNRDAEGRSLKRDGKAKAAIKAYLDAAVDMRRFAASFSVKSGDKDLGFYADFDPFAEVLEAVTPIYNKTRNYLSGRLYTTEKVKLNFGSSVFLGGWDENVEATKLGVLLFREGRYFLGVIAKGQGNLFKKVPDAKTDDVYKKMRLKTLTGASKMLPHVVFSDSGMKAFNPDGEILRIYKQGTFLKGKNFSLSDCHKLIDFYKECIGKRADWDRFTFKFSNTESYEDISGFYREVEEYGYSLKYRDIDAAVIDSLVENGQLYLFEIWHKDFSDKSKGKPDLSTMYWRALFDPKTKNGEIYRLNGGAEMFYRKASIRDADVIVHKAGDAVRSKNPLNPKRERVLKYDIIKDRRFTMDHFQLNVPITINATSPAYSFINTEAKLAIRETEGVHVIGVSRGENNLIQICVIDPEGHVVENRSLNVIESRSGKNIVRTDYAKLLAEREAARMTERKSWASVEGIKQLKAGYIGQVVRVLADLMLKYNAVIAIEDLNLGFKQNRQKIEKAVYQQLEQKLITKLNLLVNKDAAPDEPGSVFKGYQLTAPFESFDRIGKQTGFIFYVSPWKTAEIDSSTGFINLFDTRYSNLTAAKGFWSSFDKIIYDTAAEAYRFDFDYRNFVNEERLAQLEGCRTRWSVFTHGKRLRPVRTDKGVKYEETDLTEAITQLLNESGIETEETNLRDALCGVSDKRFHEEMLSLFGLTVQMRNGSDIVSPVMDLNTGGFFTASKDENSALNIARKGLILVERIKGATVEELMPAPKKDRKKGSDKEKVVPVSLVVRNNEWLQVMQK